MKNRFKTSRISSDFTEISLMNDTQKKDLCVSLLNEFGAKVKSISSKGEILHSCVLPFGGHKNGDANPSANLNYKKLTFNCWGCGNSGGLLWFISACRNESTEQTRNWLKNETGIGGEQSLSSLLDFFDAIWSPEKTVTPVLPKLDPSLLNKWLYLHPYMTEKRGIPEDTLMRFLVGYDPEYEVKLGEKLVVKSPRIIIPHFWGGKLVGWVTRRLIDDGTPKYVNSPGFPKDLTLFNDLIQTGTVTVVESPMSVLSKAHMGNIVATFGANVTERQMRLLSMRDKVILFFDNDNAGYNATREVGEYLLPYTNVLVADNPYNADPADMDDETYRFCCIGAIPYSFWKEPEGLKSLLLS